MLATADNILCVMLATADNILCVMLATADNILCVYSTITDNIFKRCVLKLQILVYKYFYILYVFSEHI